MNPYNLSYHEVKTYEIKDYDNKKSFGFISTSANGLEISRIFCKNKFKSIEDVIDAFKKEGLWAVAVN